MGLQLSAAIATARGIMQDTDSTGYRYSDADLLQYANDALDVLVKLTPHLFYTDGDVACIKDSAMQAVSYDDAARLVEVRRIKGGNAVLPCDRATLDAYSPGWQSAASGAAVNWMPVADDPMRFLISPPAPAGQILEVLYVRVPPEYTSGQDTGLPTTMSDPIADYVAARAEQRDAEHVLSERAAQLMTSFVAKAKGALA